jgi:hypothetical protein
MRVMLGVFGSSNRPEDRDILLSSDCIEKVRGMEAA